MKIIDNKIKEKELVKRSDSFGFISNSDLEKERKLAIKAELKAQQDKIV